MSRPHDLGSRECWCGPELYRPCLECVEEDPDCWRCDGEGRLRVPPGEYVDESEPLVVVHPEPEEGGAP